MPGELPPCMHLTRGVGTLAWVPEPKGTGAFPISHRRIITPKTPFATPLTFQGQGRYYFSIGRIKIQRIP